MINIAIEKIEMAIDNSNDGMMKMLGQQVIDNITTNDIAEKILVEGKTLAGCKKVFDEYASKNRKGNQSVIDPHKAEELIFEYFEIDNEVKTGRAGIINILDFIKQ